MVAGWAQWDPSIGWSLGLIAVGFAVWFLRRLVHRFHDAWPSDRGDNGIRVGAPKVYDNRSLVLKIEELEKQLQTVKSIDQGGLKSGIGTLQGERISDLNSELRMTRTARVPKEGGEAGGKSAQLPVSGETARSGADAQPAASDAARLKWSLRPLDLLREQISLSYEIFNVRMLLERALSDRLLGAAARLQAVIGVPISIDPPPYATGCAATVEFRIAKKVSLVALFPQQETFNTLGIDRRRFQLSSVGSSEQISGAANVQSRTQATFLQSYAEVVAMERESDLNELVVAWQFRPAPGRRTVTPGLRQMLMVIALPAADADNGSVKLEGFVRSSWHKWSKGSEIAARGAGWRSVWSNRVTFYDDWGSHGLFEVPTTEFVEQSLTPEIDSIEWLRVGKTKAAIILKGKNFFSGAIVALGDTVLRAEPELIIKSERSLQILAPIEALQNDAVLSGRYGPSIPIVMAPDAALHPMHITDAFVISSPSGDSFGVTLTLSTRNFEPVDWERFVRLPDPILFINGVPVQELLVFSRDPDAAGRVTGSVSIRCELLPSRLAVFVLRWPFYGDDWSLRYQTYDPQLRVSVSRFTSGSLRTGLLFSGSQFQDKVTVVLDREYAITPDGCFTRIAPDLLKLELSTDLINSHNECFLCQPNQASVRVVIPKEQTNVQQEPGRPELPKEALPPPLTP